MASKNALPTLQDHPDYRAAVRRLSELRTDAQQTEREISNYTPPAEDPADEALAYLEGRPSTTTQAPPLKELRHRREVLKSALKIQEQRVQAVRSEVGTDAVRKIRPEYEKILRRMADLAVELGHLADEEQAIRDHLFREDIPFTGDMPPVPLRGMLLRVESSPVNQWLDAVEREYGVRPKIPRK